MATSGYLSIPATACYATPSTLLPAANVAGLVAAAVGGNVACATGTFSGNVSVANVSTAAGGSVVANALVVAATGTFNLATGNLFVNGAAYQGLAPFRNRLHNGSFAVNQRQVYSAAAGGSTGNAFPLNTTTWFLDRWAATSSGAATLVLNVMQVQLTSSDAPYLAGFPYSARATAATAGTASSFVMPFQQCIEGPNVADLAWGSTGAQPATLSFWLRASSAMTVSVSLSGPSATYCFVQTVAAAASSAWSYKTVAVPACPNGSWAATATTGSIWVRLGVAGSGNTTASLGSWLTGGPFYSATTTTNWITTTGAYVEFAGVQLEKGTSATAFEVRPFAIEYSLCLRYFFQNSFPTGTAGPYPLSNGGYVSSISNNNGYIWFTFPVTMRAAPAFAWFNSLGGVGNMGINNGFSPQGLTLIASNTSSATVYMISSGSSYAIGASWNLTTQSGNSGNINFSADI